MRVDGREQSEAGLIRMDTHCHSRASDGPAVAALSFLNMPECYSPPEKVYDQARARGMDLVTITDHDSIKGAMELVERGFEGFVAGEEVTVFFPEDRCKLHVLVWGISPTQDEELSRLGLRDDVYAFAHWLREHRLAHALAHPLYMQNGRLTRWHIERCALLFQGFEVLNGAHTDRHREPLDRFLESLTEARIQHLVDLHGMEAVWPRAWEKARTGGSDDHGLLNVGRTWTGVLPAGGTGWVDPAEFFARVMRGECEPGGAGGHGALLAHQLTTVGAHYYAERVASRQSTRGRYIASKLLRFAGVDLPKPSRARLAAHLTGRRVLRRNRGKTLPIVDALREALGEVLVRYPELRDRLARERWDEGSALADHERMAAFADELTAVLTQELNGSTLRAMRKRDKTGLVDHAISYAIVSAAQVPYIFSLFYQNKEREFVERFAHETAGGDSAGPVLGRDMRVSLFTDTLGDVNGVSRFIGDVAFRARMTGRDLHVITSTRRGVPEGENIFNFDPVFATSMPKYEELELVLPPIVPILRHIDRHQPDCIHISTPGPVGFVGFLAAKMLRVPVLGVYHTDFPFYIEKFFEDRAFTLGCEKFMQFFYGNFSAVFTRSEEYVGVLSRLGIERERCCALLPGFASGAFLPGCRDETVWERFAGLRRGSAKVLYVGRVSVEKNLPFLTGVWKKTQQLLRERGLDADLVVVGDGPYRTKMERELRGVHAHFVGYRRGQELGTIYASADVFVFPSVTDTLGQVVMESQGSGLPVLVTDRGGPKEVVNDGRTGFVLPADDTRVWAERIVELVADKERRQRMGWAAHEHVQQFSLENSFEHFWKVHTQAWRTHLAARGVVPRTRPSTR